MEARDVLSFSCNGRAYRVPSKPTIALCVDGSGPDYLTDALGRGLMPRLQTALRRGGRVLAARAQMPTLTNVNNASIVTGVSASYHGISGNHYLTPSGDEAQLTHADALRAKTILAAAQDAGVAVLAVTAKDKLRGLLGAGGVPAISAERAHELSLPGCDGQTGCELVGRRNPGIYDPALSAYTIDLSLAAARRLGARLVYCSLTDYVQHACAPGQPMADAYYRELDERLGRMLSQGWRIGLVADHGMNAKATVGGEPNVVYLADHLAEAGVRGARVLLPITDPYVRHHGALGSAAFVYVESAEAAAARACLAGLPGVEAVLDRAAAAAAFELPVDRIGELMVCADATTVLGKTAADHDLSSLDGPLRSHGGLHEAAVPMVVCQSTTARDDDGRLRNGDLFHVLLNAGEDA